MYNAVNVLSPPHPHAILTISFPRSWVFFLFFAGDVTLRLPLKSPGRWVLAHGARLHPVYSPAPRTAQEAQGCRAGSRGSSGLLQRPRRGLHRCPRPRPVRAAHCPVADRHRVRSRELPLGWRLRSHLGPSAGRIRSKWRWNLQIPETTWARQEVRDRRLWLAEARGETAEALLH